MNGGKDWSGPSLALLAFVAFGLTALVLAFSAEAPSLASSESRLSAERPLFKPSALALSPDDKILFVAGAGDGSLAVIDTEKLEVVAEKQVGSELTDIALNARGDLLVACDRGAGVLRVFDVAAGEIAKRHTVRVPEGAECVVVFDQGDATWGVVSCRWARRLVFVECRRGQVAGEIELEYCPGVMHFREDRGWLFVADAFGPHVTVFSLAPELQPDGRYVMYSTVVRERLVPGHNIRGLTTDRQGEWLLVTHMTLTESAPTTHENVHWGVTMTSNLRVIPLDLFVGPVENPYSAGRTHFIGDAGHAAGDPGTVVVTELGRVVMALSGVHDLGLVPLRSFGIRRVDVGRRPVDLVLSRDERYCYVANQFSDSVSVVDLASDRVTKTIELRAERPLTLVEEGERAFYDATLSLDGWYSCHSCHTDGHTCGLNADTLGDGSYGAPKNIPTLYGTGVTGPWGWIGAFDSLDEQVRSSLLTSMRSPRDPSPRLVAALVAYLRSLPAPPRMAYRPLDAERVERGRHLFERLHCGSCHRPIGFYTSEGVADVGLDDGPGGNSRFNPPSLRGLAYTAPYFHDGRAATLEDVFRVHRHKVPPRITDEQIADLVEFLLSL